MSSNMTSIVVPLIGEPRISELVWSGFLRQIDTGYQIFIYAGRAPEQDILKVAWASCPCPNHGRDARATTVHWVQGQWKHFAGLFNQAIQEVPTQFVLFAPPQIILNADCVTAFQDALRSNPARNFAYCDYRYSDGQEVRLIDDPGDITERQDWGQVFAVRKEAILQKGGVDEEHPAAVFYDLRLKLGDDSPLLHIPKVLYQIPALEAALGHGGACTSIKKDIGKDVLFYPGQGQYGGFSYLFYSPEQERQFEQVFYQMLKRRGAYLDRIPPITPFDLGPLSSPAVSVIMPVYNRSDFVGSAIESVLQGTFRDFEILLIDNGSTDNTCEVVKKYTKDRRVYLLHCPENIIAKSLNTGVRAARGRYIAQLDSDDEYTPDTLTMMVEYLEKHPTAGLAISYYELMDVTGKTLKDFGVIKHDEYNRNNILRVDGAGAVRVWRKSVLKELGGFDEKVLGGYGEDYDLVLKVSERYEVGRVPKVLYRYRRHSGNTDALVENQRKIRAKSIARQNALHRRRELNLQLGKE